MKEKKIEKCCGNCCWFYEEMTDGEGLCALSDPSVNETRCDYFCSHEVYVSRQEMRHHMAVLLQQSRFQEWFDGGSDGVVFPPNRKAVMEALKFAYKYMKVFSKL